MARMHFCILASIIAGAHAQTDCIVTIWAKGAKDCAAGNGVYNLKGFDNHPGTLAKITAVCGKAVTNWDTSAGGSHASFVKFLKAGTDIEYGGKKFKYQKPADDCKAPTTTTTAPGATTTAPATTTAASSLESNKRCFKGNCLEWAVTTDAAKGDSIELTLSAKAKHVSLGFSIGKASKKMSPADVVSCWVDASGTGRMQDFTNVRGYDASKKTDTKLYTVKSAPKMTGDVISCVVTRPLKVPAAAKCDASAPKQDLGDELVGVLLAWGDVPAGEFTPRHGGGLHGEDIVNLLSGGASPSTAFGRFEYTLILGGALWLFLIIYGLLVTCVINNIPSARLRCSASKIMNKPLKSCYWFRNIALAQLILILIVVLYLVALPFILTQLTGGFDAPPALPAGCSAPSGAATTAAAASTVAVSGDAAAINDAAANQDVSFDQFTGTGAVTSLFLALALFPTARHSLLFCLFGLPFERMIEMHRWASRATILAGFVHGLLHFISSASSGNLGRLYQPLNLCGILCFITMLAMAILALEPIRRRCYEVFLYPHQFLAMAAIVLAMIHRSVDYVNVIILFVPTLWYCIDKILRIYFGCRAFNIKRMQALPGGVTKLTVGGGLEFEPGQYCWLLIPAVSRLQYHPFSISSGGGRDFTFHIKDMGAGTFTHDLNILAPAYDKTEKDLENMQARQIAVIGPYGKLAIDPTKYSVMMLVAGGIGVTPMASILDWILRMSDEQKLAEVCPHLRLVVFIWTCRGSDAFQHWFPDLLTKAQAHPKIKLELHDSRKRTAADAEAGAAAVGPQIKINPGRADVKAIMEFNNGRNPEHGTAVYACGPEPMLMATQAVAVDIGAEFHKETFLF